MLGALTVCSARSTRAQSPATVAVVNVRVTDTTGAPVDGATVIILHGSSDAAVFLHTTGTDGRAHFEFPVDTGRYRVVVRKLGFVQTMRRLRPMARRPVSVTLAISRIPPMLDTVRVDARARSDDYHIDAMMIAHIQHHYVKDAYDAMRDINPGMLGDGARGCRRAENIWVNGVKVKYSPGPAYDMPEGTSVVTAADILGIPGATLHAAPFPRPHAALDDILALVRPQDIASIDYRNCWDNSMPERGMRNAIFITLKPGFEFDDRRGSYPRDSVPGL
jgi:hypothetical protein